jgi:hypothetical protein
MKTKAEKKTGLTLPGQKKESCIYFRKFSLDLFILAHLDTMSQLAVPLLGSQNTMYNSRLLNNEHQE